MEQRLVILSGRSGAGKTSALHTLEDLGYLCIDNIPLSLLPNTVQRLINSDRVDKLAIGVDIRNLNPALDDFDDVLGKVKEIITPEIIFLTAQDETIITRFSATRRKHPLANRYQKLVNALGAESELLKPILAHASFVIDTSKLNVHELKERLIQKLGHDKSMVVFIQSFGFKHGVPLDADYVFDVRMLPNPHWEADLKTLTGKDQQVINFFKKHDEVEQMFGSIQAFFDTWLPSFKANNRHAVSIAIGCTGGQHRSVFIAEKLAQYFSKNWQVKTLHRETKHWKIKADL